MNIINFKKINWYNFFAWFLILILVALAVMGGYMDNLSSEHVKENGWSSLLYKDYIKGLIISPIWIIVAFLFNRAIESENTKYKRRENQLFGLIKRKRKVDVSDIREIMQDAYDQEDELKEIKDKSEKFKEEVKLVDDSELKT